MPTRDSFELQFAPALLRELAARYQYDDENKALMAGSRIAGGENSRTNLEVIFRWKTGGRGISRLSRNTDTEIEDALRMAVGAQTERAAVAVLCGLYGVEVPVASAVLTAINPQRYTIIDFRALESLGIKSYYATVDYYLVYLAQCRDLAHQHSIGLRELDRALWQWSKEQAQAE
jgi:hypothetical protein